MLVQDNNAHSSESTPAAKDLIKKMEEISKTSLPEWCATHTVRGLDELKGERNALVAQIRQAQEAIAGLDSRITKLEYVKNALLGAEGPSLMDACAQVFSSLGWQVKLSELNENELWLAHANQTQIITRVVKSTAQAKRTELAQLGESVITYWGEYETEPKGVFVASTWSNRPPSERSEPDYPEALVEFAAKKNLCLVTTMQLVHMYDDLELGRVSPEEIRLKLQETRGLFPGYLPAPEPQQQAAVI